MPVPVAPVATPPPRADVSKPGLVIAVIALALALVGMVAMAASLSPEYPELCWDIIYSEAGYGVELVGMGIGFGMLLSAIVILVMGFCLKKKEKVVAPLYSDPM